MRQASDGLLAAAHEVTKTYRPRNASPTVALQGVSMELSPGEAVAIVGPSGSGKSTLLSILGTLETADAGSVQVLGRDVTRLNRSEAADLRFGRLGFVFQQFYLLPELTVMENVLTRFIGRRRPPDTVTKAEALLDRIGLGHKKAALPRELSGGEQQRVCIARALVTDPDLILADEPTGNLDSDNGRTVMEMMLSLVRGRGAGLVLVTHDRGLASKLDRVLEMRDGLIRN